jgi:hypothetical protein
VVGMAGVMSTLSDPVDFAPPQRSLAFCSETFTRRICAITDPALAQEALESAHPRALYCLGANSTPNGVRMFNLHPTRAAVILFAFIAPEWGLFAFPARLWIGLC